MISSDFHRFEIPERYWEYHSKIDVSRLFFEEIENRIKSWEQITIVIIGQAGAGKCYRKGQTVLMYDGTIKSVEDIKVGDLLMGPDSKPRRVLRLARGVDSMVEVCPTKGEPFVVTHDHILTLVGNKLTNNMIEEPTIDEWNKWSKNRKSNFKMVRVGVDFASNSSVLPLSPYFLGVWLGDGDGNSGSVAVTTQDDKILEALTTEAKRFGLHVTASVKVGTMALHCYLSGKGLKRDIHRWNAPNPIVSELNRMGLYGTDSGSKFIPMAYKISSRKHRLELLAGLLDTDGSYYHTFDYISKSRTLADDVAFVARSLGFAAYVKSCYKHDQNGHGGQYYRVSISGELDEIPTRIPRKRASKRTQTKNVLHVGFTTKWLGREDFYGFTLDGDGRHLLSDFTVVHNSLAGLLIAKKLCKIAGTTLDIKKDVTGFLPDTVQMISTAEPNTVIIQDEQTRSIGTGSRSMQWTHANLLKCYDDKTEVLTKDGWKFFKDVTANDEFATLDLPTNNLVYQTPSEVVAYPYNGKMYRLKTKSLDLCVLPNHRMYVSRRGWKAYKPYEFAEAKDIKGKQVRYRRGGVDWKGEERPTFVLPAIVNGRNVSIRDKSLNMDAWLRFLGLYIAEGSRAYTPSNGHYSVVITQSKPRVRTQIRRIAKSLGFNFYDDAFHNLVISNRQLYEWLENVGDGAPNKQIPNEFLGLSKRQLGILFEYMMLGDGHVDKYGTRFYGTSSPRLRDQVQELALKLGLSSTYNSNGHKGDTQWFEGRTIIQRHDAWLIVVTSKTNEVGVYPRTNHVEKWADYNGTVYGVTVPSTLLFVRRGGRPVFCGNTVMRYKQIHFIGIGVELLEGSVPSSVINYILIAKTRELDPKDPRKTLKINLELWTKTLGDIKMGDWIPIGRVILMVAPEDEKTIQEYLEFVKAPTVEAFQTERGMPELTAQQRFKEAIDSGMPLSAFDKDTFKPVVDSIDETKQEIADELQKGMDEVNSQINKSEHDKDKKTDEKKPDDAGNT